MFRPLLLLTFSAMAFWSIAVQSYAAGGTRVVATQGKPAYVQPTWPGGVAELVNDPARAAGWNPWFTEWPNDVHQYSFDIKSSDDINRLIEKLAAVKTEIKQLRLSPVKEPDSIGWVTRLPEDNHIAAMFSVGDQARIDDWYAKVRQPFGLMNFTATPVAVPPTLTLYVQHDAIKFDELKIPEGIEVSMGRLPTLFHEMNLALNPDGDEKAKTPDAAKQLEQFKKNLDEPGLKTLEKIQAFLEARKKATE